MNNSADLVEELDDEAALFTQEMQQEAREEARKRRNTLTHAMIHNLPREAHIDASTLRRLLQRHNQAVAMLREFIALHPEDGDLVSRARRLTDSPE